MRRGFLFGLGLFVVLLSTRPALSIDHVPASHEEWKQAYARRLAQISDVNRCIEKTYDKKAQVWRVTKCDTQISLALLGGVTKFRVAREITRPIALRKKAIDWNAQEFEVLVAVDRAEAINDLRTCREHRDCEKAIEYAREIGVEDSKIFSIHGNLAGY